jgi:hypothetical protein
MEGRGMQRPLELQLTPLQASSHPAEPAEPAEPAKPAEPAEPAEPAYRWESPRSTEPMIAPAPAC